LKISPPMLKRCASRLPKARRLNSTRGYSTTTKPLKVAVLGASGGIGQPLSMLLKTHGKGFTQLSLYDIVNTPGVAADLSHIPTPIQVKGYVGDAQLDEAVKGADIIVIPAGVPRKPGMTRDDLFNTNAGIVYKLATSIAKNAANSHVLIISNPVNSTVPIVAETFKKHGVQSTKKVYGVSTLDILRANTFYGEAKGMDPSKLEVTVVGGHAGITILPLFSQLPNVGLTQEQVEKLTRRVQFGGDEVVEAKAGAGSATLAMAVAAFRFTNSLLRALAGEKVTECAFVQSNVTSGVDYFASRVTLGPQGAQEIHPVGKLSAFEEAKLKEAVPELAKNIQRGKDFVKSQN